MADPTNTFNALPTKLPGERRRGGTKGLMPDLGSFHRVNFSACVRKQRVLRPPIRLTCSTTQNVHTISTDSQRESDTA